VAYLRYRGRDGMERIINTGFTRYSVVFTGEHLPEGTIADAVYLVLNDIYRDILNHAPVRPLNYGYLKALTPMAQRFYELLSYKMFAALKHRHPQATLRYADYCLLATQQRYVTYDQVKKQRKRNKKVAVCMICSLLRGTMEGAMHHGLGVTHRYREGRCQQPRGRQAGHHHQLRSSASHLH
jgi:hypothetical protein